MGMRSRRHTAIAAALFAALLAGCNSADQALTPAPGDVPQFNASGATPGSGDATAIPPTQTTTTSAGAAPPQAGQTAALAPGAEGTLRFTPVIGAPVSAVTPLSRQLAAEARGRGFTIVSAAGHEGRHVLKGYFSAFNDGARTTIVYVWDVLDPSGARLHRIQGQEEVQGAAGTDPWASVPPATMERIATRTFQDYQTWLGAARG
jgi:hypothetical protein